MLECQRRAREKYRAKVKTIRFELFPSEKDIQEYLEYKAANGEKIATYIKNLIRNDMFRQEKEQRDKKFEEICKKVENGFYDEMLRSIIN